MRSALTFVALFASSASAYTLFSRQGTIICGGGTCNVLSCSVCVVPENLGCSVTDAACLCHNDAYINSTLACVETTCPNITAAEQVVQQLCNNAGVTLTAFPTRSVTTPGSSAATSLGAASDRSTSVFSGGGARSSATGAISSISGSTSSASTGSPAASTGGSESAKGKSPIPIGPIVGGVVGLLALLAISGLIWLCCIRPKRAISTQVFTPEDPQRTEKPLDSQESGEMLNSGHFSLLRAPTDAS